MIDVLGAELRLLRAHVGRSAHDPPEFRVQCFLGEALVRCLGDAKVDDLRHRLPIRVRDQNVSRLEVAVNDAPVVGVLNAVADLKKDTEPFLHRQLVVIAVLVDRTTLNILHHEVGTAVRRGTRFVHPSDVGVVHERQCLSLGLEPQHDLFSVHPLPDELQRDTPADGLLLLGQIDHPHAPIADLLQDAVRTDRLGDGLFAGGRVVRRQPGRAPRSRFRGTVRDRLQPRIKAEQVFDQLTEVGIVATLRVQEGRELVLGKMARRLKQRQGSPVLFSVHPLLPPRGHSCFGGLSASPKTWVQTGPCVDRANIERNAGFRQRPSRREDSQH